FLNNNVVANRGVLGLSGFPPSVVNSGSSATISPHSTQINFALSGPSVSVSSGTLAFSNASPLPNATQQANYQGTVTLGGSGGVPFSSGPPYTFSLISQTGGNAWTVAELSP